MGMMSEGWFRPGGQTPHLAETQGTFALALSTWKKRFRTEYKLKWEEKSKGLEIFFLRHK